eukprot:scaffold94539_cov21-Tisochrysis_lutea.AAC.3
MPASCHPKDISGMRIHNICLQHSFAQKTYTATYHAPATFICLRCDCSHGSPHHILHVRVQGKIVSAVSTGRVRLRECGLAFPQPAADLAELIHSEQ